MVRVTEIDEQYINQLDWLVHENANKNISVTSLEWYRYQKLIIPQLVVEVFGEEIAKLHFSGWIHIHKLNDGGLDKPYCIGYDLYPIITQGLKTPTITSKPPKHLDSAMDLIVNFIYVACQENTGAIGYYGWDVLLAPFIRVDGLSYRYVKQQVQRFVFNLNYPARVGYQTPFSNIVIALNNPYYVQRVVNIQGESHRLDMYVDEAKLLIKALCEVLLEGDATGKPHTFPIPTVIYNNEFLKLINDFEDLFWDVVRLRGSFYFMNGFNSTAFDLFSFCCRVLANHRRIQLLHSAKGIWTIPPGVGSINYVSINLPRVVAWSMAKMHEEKYIFDKLYDLMLKAREALNILRRRYERFLRLGLYPIKLTYLGLNAFKYHYNTIAIVGLAESYTLLVQDRHVFTDKNYVSDYVRYCRTILEFMNDVEREFEELDHVLYNLEQSPAESTTYKFAKSDWNHEDYSIRDYIRLFLPIAMLYTSQITPPYCQWDIWTQLDVEAHVQPLFTGGVVKLVFDHVKRDRETVRKLIDYAFSKGVIYLAYTPTITHCENCSFWDIGIYERCPKCGKPTEYWSRIVGYYRPLSNWNEGKKLEFRHRVGVKL